MGSARDDEAARPRVLLRVARGVPAAVVVGATFAFLLNSGMGPGRAVADSPTFGPVGVEAPALLVGSDFGDARLVALDTRGEIVVYGAGEGTLSTVSVCPGESRLVESAWGPDARPFLAVRDLRTFEVVREIDPTTALAAEFGVGDVACRDELGEEIVVFAPGAGIAALGRGTTVVVPGSWRLGQLAEDHAIVVPEKGHEVHLIGIADGTDRLLYELPSGGERSWDIHSMAVSLSGDRIAIVDWFLGDQRHDHTLRVFSLPGGTPLHELSYPGHGGTTTGWWVDGDTLAIAFLGDSGPNREPIWGTVILVDATDGTETGRWQGLNVRPHLVVDGVLIGTPVSDRPGTIAAVPITGGVPSIIEVFETAPLQGVHGLFPAPVTAVAALPALDGAELLAATAGAPLSDPVSDILGALPVIIAGVVAVAVLVVIALTAWQRRRSRVRPPPGGAPIP